MAALGFFGPDLAITGWFDSDPTLLGTFDEDLIAGTVVSDNPSVVPITFDRVSFGTDTTPTLVFLGTDPFAHDLRYQI